MDDRIERLWQEEYRVLAGHIAWHRRKEARELNRTLAYANEDD